MEIILKLVDVPAIEQKLDDINQRMETMMATFQEVLDVVRGTSGKIDSLQALIEGLKQQVNDVLSGVTLPPNVQAQLDEIFEVAKSNSDDIDSSLNENPEPSPAPAPPPEEPPEEPPVNP